MRRLFTVSILFILIAAFLGCDSNNADKTNDGYNNTYRANNVANISISVIKSYPHDTASFTQGLVVYKGQLYEGTGGAEYSPVGSKFSQLLRVNIETGKAEKAVSLAPQYFGEGITILNDTVYQLTWREHKVFVYTLPDLKKVKELPLNTEGWGITTDGKQLIVSDGSSNLYFYEPSTFRLMRTQAVTQNGDLSFNLNELEYIEGYVYANQWQQPYIYKIEPESGQIVGRIDVTQIWERIKRIDPMADVPNGIAYDAEAKKIYITGKKWPELYEVQLGN
ncbi:glutaminyl-peptide cyclotransferase [Niabella digestorum]|jgi:Glutamine cyclotransferase|uniref:Glutaminyl-peptide cyclotransferase n=1 Tax=Niabella digestorum TaxID=3117701 RepID=A0ABU7RG97_9BACT